jgi:hypothetical protein
LTVGPDHVLALVKVSEEGEGGITLSPDAVEAFSAFLEAKKAEVQPAVVSEGAGVQEKTKKKAKEVPPVKILHSWAAPEDKIGEFNYPKEKKKDFSGKDVELLGPSYDEGTPTEKGDWRNKIKDREDMIQYLKTGLRYWYSSEWHGSERRKTPA